MAKVLLTLAVTALFTTIACSGDDGDSSAGGIFGGGNEGSGQEAVATDLGESDSGLGDSADSGTGLGDGYSEASHVAFMDECNVIDDEAWCDCIYENISRDVPFEEFEDFMADFDDESAETPDWLFDVSEPCGAPDASLPTLPPPSTIGDPGVIRS